MTIATGPRGFACQECGSHRIAIKQAAYYRLLEIRDDGTLVFHKTPTPGEAPGDTDERRLHCLDCGHEREMLNASIYPVDFR